MKLTSHGNEIVFLRGKNSVKLNITWDSVQRTLTSDKIKKNKLNK